MDTHQLSMEKMKINGCPVFSQKPAPSSSCFRHIGQTAFLGQFKQAFTPPHADHPNTAGISTVHNAEWRMNHFPQKRLLEFWDNPTDIWIPRNAFHPLQNFRHQPLANIRRALF
jgi:hypothetical protein